ncbi:transcriptional regulator [Actinoplanes philippinensis]|uniref:DNA-binding response regulator, OmpR family, contains REC and winged-helix (WHTH) domain n=1 Tax=Actinoplanes philippinensis TaxID=35752 RepID=A0A1I2HJN7_9ACTN|nr:response regulator transcription factor [Actinoplanes philippinensis]GIE82974.1 transcriptional regulator [Actinoplanes philippinensis]SFF29728.1 DNA-binding response regulator, OmpR family, contains REC and winged-helix (wHTH) domain [Actinoplanes philippinensis]
MNLLLLTDGHADVLPALDLLPYTVQVAPRDERAVAAKDTAVILVDASTELNQARATCRALRGNGAATPLIAVVREGGLVAVGADWCVDDFVLTTAGPAEVAARLSMVAGRRSRETATGDGLLQVGDLVIDANSYTTRLRGEALALTYKEFELLRYLAQHPGRVFSRDQLLREVWGYDYFGGTRTVDVHVRRLRAKLGPRCETMIGTVRQVGYKFVTPPGAERHGVLPVPAAESSWDQALVALR